MREQIAAISMKPGYREITIHYKANGRIFTLKRKIVVPTNKEAVRFEYTDILQHAAKHALGTILVDIQDPDLHAKITPLGDGRLKEPVVIFHHRPVKGKETQKYMPGNFLVEEHDLVFGWSSKSKYYDQFEVEVEAGKTKTVTIKRDFKKHAENHPDWSTQTSHNFIWSKSDIAHRQEFTFSTSQAKVVQQLLEGLAANKPEVKEVDLLKIANEEMFETSKHKTLSTLFNNGKHPAWGTMIAAGKSKGTWRLQEPEGTTKAARQGTIQLDVQDKELSVKILSDKSGATYSGFTSGLKSLPNSQHKYQTAAGDYQIWVASNNAGWMVGGAFVTPLRYKHSKIKVTADNTTTVVITRDYKKLADVHPDWKSQRYFSFHWLSSEGKLQNNSFLPEPAKVVHQLFKAFAEGKPEVPEADLLKIANENRKTNKHQSLTALFNEGNNGKHPAWETMIVAGKTKGTWRLQEPKSATENLPAY